MRVREGKQTNKTVPKRATTKRPAGSEPLNLFNIHVDQDVLSLIPRAFAKQYNVFPIEKRGKRLSVAMSDTRDYNTINELRLITGLLIRPIKANGRDIQQLIVRDYPSEINLEGLQEETESSTVEMDNRSGESPIIKLVNTLLQDAIDRGASDIHFDPQEKYLTVRIRVDGELRKLETLPKNIQAGVISRLKIISSLDITETRVPQDGRAMIKNGRHVVDLRVSVLPVIHGEKIVIRILDRSSGIRKLEDFYFADGMLEEFRRLLRNPHGIILVTGPTGSGKSSTLYAAIQELNQPNVNIITVEDPVEYQLEGINQVAVNSNVGLTFASGLRSILRQDPNIVMVGEIRDGETAEIAIRASMTGHLVISTLHTNDSVSTINRLMDMGVDTFLIANSLEGVLAQRLVRTICSSCKVKEPPTDEERHFLAEIGVEVSQLAKGKGCAKCSYTGYKGRMAVQELLTVTPELRRLITEGANNEELMAHVQAAGMSFLIDDGLSKVLAGYTTIDEVLKVVMQE
ncbi:GspE/PulE family protein [Enterococcus faecalis]